MHLLPTVGKARKPKFEVHLNIFDLTNVPLVSGSSFIKWHLAHSMHAEHRGRTSKCPISNHRVEYNFNKVIPSVRVAIEKSNQLAECPFELEILQEFAVAEKITLGHVKLNLSEFVEESEALTRDLASPPRKTSGSTSVSPAGSSSPAPSAARTAEDGIVRRYLMQDSKINSTLKIGILMVQVDGDRHFTARPLKTAPVFGGIAGLMAPEQAEDGTGPLPSLSKSRDVAEIQDLYRQCLIASWSQPPDEPTPDEVIEDLFNGGNGWPRRQRIPTAQDTQDTDDVEDTDPNSHTLRPGDFRGLALHHNKKHHRYHFPHHHRRKRSGSSDKSASTVTAAAAHQPPTTPKRASTGHPSRDTSRDSRAADDASSTKSSSTVSLAPTLGGGSSSEGEPRLHDVGGGRRPRELQEMDIREDLVAWTLPSVGTYT